MKNKKFEQGISIIKEMAKKAPERPGVYHMFGEGEKVLYVGKARNLAKRITSYTRAKGLTSRILAMISETRRMEIIITGNEIEALILEANLIKSLKPRYNILLKDDKSFPIITIYEDHDFPRIARGRSRERLGGYEYGPFISASSVNTTIELMKRSFLLRSCSDNFFATRKKPCLEYQIKRCSAPCTGKISQEEYHKTVAEARSFLAGKSNYLKEKLIKEMEEASEQMEYERAAIIRDRIKAITHIQAKQNLNINEVGDIDFLAIEQGGEISAIQLFRFRKGLNLGHKAFFIDHDGEDRVEEILANFIMQFYQIPPEKLYINIALPEKGQIEKALSLLAGHKVVITTAKEKRSLMNIVEENARQALENKIRNIDKIMAWHTELATIFHLDKVPRYIEIYDNSHISGSAAIGALVAAGPEGFIKKQYRKFNIVSTKEADDYTMLAESLERRLRQLNSSYQPDLFLIDGGKGHLSTAQRVLEKFGVTIPVICIAKGPERNAGREEFYSAEFKNGITLPFNSSLLYYLQRLRDEVHRYAITSHRRKRSINLVASALDKLEGVGEKRKKLLLHHFGSVQAIKMASLEDLMRIPGISRKLAQSIIEQL